MASSQKKHPVESIWDDLASEPVIGWLFAQILYCSQPILTAFWGEDQISRWAERFSGEDANSPDAQPTVDTR